MNYIDIIFLVIIIYFTFIGLKKGIIKSIGGIISIIIGFYGASLFYPQASNWLQGLSSVFTEIIANIVSFILLFIVINRLSMLVVSILDKISSLPIIGFFNKLLGGIFGFLAGSLIIGIIVLILSSFSIDGVSSFENSKIVPVVNKVIDFIKPLIPESIDTSFLENDWMENLKEAINNLPNNIVNVDDLMSYLKENVNLPEEVLNNIKETQFSGVSNLNIDEIKIKLEDYINNR